MQWIAVALGGAVGAMLRHGTATAVQVWSDGRLPYGTFVVNLVGSFVLGVLAGLVLHGSVRDDVRLFVGTGMMGALTTYSTFSLETVSLLGEGRLGAAALNAGGTLLVCGVATAVGLWLGRKLAGAQ